MGTQDLIIVGAGIAGLSAGFYSQLNGLRTTIFEMHSVPGGLCAAWKRWEELGVFQDQRFMHPEGELLRVAGSTKSLELPQRSLPSRGAVGEPFSRECAPLPGVHAALRGAEIHGLHLHETG